MPHPALLFIFLLLPNTTLRDWQRADAPHLHALLRQGSMALMNARTAERDTITPSASCYSLGAGARMGAATDTSRLAYSALPGNLGASLRARGVIASASDPLACLLVDGTRSEPSSRAAPDAPTLIVSNLGSNPSQADAQIEKWISVARAKHGEIMLLSPSPSPAEYTAFDQLVPVVVWTQDASSGLLFSPSTRHTGLITNTDIAPTVAAYFNTTLRGPTYGTAIQRVPLPDQNGSRLLEQADVAWMHQARALRALPYVAGGLAALIALFGVLAWQRYSVATVAMLIPLVPLVLLLSNTLPVAASLLISALGGAYVLRTQFRQGLTYVGGVTALFVVADAWTTDGQFTGASLLGYSPLEGARYYGIGNETMGAVIGAGILLTAGLLPRRDGRIWSAFVWIVITATLAWPTAGAKAGGLFVGLVALATLFAATSGHSWRDVRVWGSLLCALALGIFGLFLLGRYGAHSHLTQAVESAGREGNGVYGSLIVRKALMDGHLVLHSVWIWVLLAAIGGGYFELRERWARMTQTDRASIAVGCAAAAACLTLNDAGVVAAAVCSLSLWAFCVLCSQPTGSTA